MNIIVILIKFLQVGAALAPVIEQLRGKGPAQFDKLNKLLAAATDAMGRGADGAAYLQTLSAEIEQLHAQGKTIDQADIDSEIGGILSVADEIEAERKKLDPPVTEPVVETPPVEVPPVEMLPVEPPPVETPPGV